jgi:hypothetical protein
MRTNDIMTGILRAPRGGSVRVLGGIALREA